MNLVPHRIRPKVRLLHEGPDKRMTAEKLPDFPLEQFEEFAAEVEVPDGGNEEGIFLPAHQRGLRSS